MGNGTRQRMPTPEEVAQFQEADRQWRLEFMPPQVDVNGMERVCVLCKAVLNPIHNRNYDGSVGGFCNKLCSKEMERALLKDGKVSVEEAELEIGKYEDWKPKKHSPVLV
ncbi:MAG: hypothetical protein MUP81_00545 [Dehalococcoidia bacterium]|nr:hypothetical protein [Dehalococcoidia bacterium]